MEGIKMAKAAWEYQVFEVGGTVADIDHKLTEMSGDGWRLVSLLPAPGVTDIFVMVVGRPKP